MLLTYVGGARAPLGRSHKGASPGRSPVRALVGCVAVAAVGFSGCGSSGSEDVSAASSVEPTVPASSESGSEQPLSRSEWVSAVNAKCDAVLAEVGSLDPDTDYPVFLEGRADLRDELAESIEGQGPPSEMSDDVEVVVQALRNQSADDRATAAALRSGGPLPEPTTVGSLPDIGLNCGTS